jgi:hypothetical protein
LKKLTGLVRFYKPEIEKTEPNPNQKKPSQTEKTEPNRFEPIFVLKNRTKLKLVGLNRFWFFFFFFLIWVWLLFFYKNRTELKMITPTGGSDDSMTGSIKGK